jgi:hypothetical protein
MESGQEFTRRIYTKLYYEILGKNKGKLSKSSVLLSLKKITSNKRFEILKDSAISGSGISRGIIDELLSKGLIRRMERLNEYIITAHGIWEIESKDNILDIDKLIQDFDEEIFDLYKTAEKPLNPKEKVILFSMVGARAFSKEASLNLKKDDTSGEAWKEIFDTSYEKMKTLNLISSTKEKLYENKGNETSLSYLLRRANDLHKKTKGIFVQVGEYKYFLDIASDEGLNMDKLAYLFKLIFTGIELNGQLIDEIYEFFIEIAYKKNNYIFDTTEHFSKPKFDSVIKEALLAS